MIGSDWLRTLANGEHGSSIYGDHWIDRPPLILGIYGAADLLGGATGVRVLGMFVALAAALCSALVAERVAGRRAFLPAGLVTGCLLSSPAVDGDRTAGELLAAAPSVLAVALLVGIARHDYRARTEPGVRALGGMRRITLLTIAGLAAACAPLIKQSALDACVAAAAWCVWRLCTDARSRQARLFLLRDASAFAAGMATALITTIGLAFRAGAREDDLMYALVGFRFDVLAALSEQSKAPIDRVTRLLDPAAGSGLLFAALLVPIGIWAARRGPAAGAGAVLLGGWIIGAVIGVGGGGYFWAHYLIQLAAPVGAAAGIALSMWRPRATVALVTVLVTIATIGQVIRADSTPSPRLLKAGYMPQSQQGVLSVADFIRRNSPSDDELVVLYARANVAYYADRRQATEFAWSSMYRAIPDARDDMLRAVTGPDRAAWIVEWQQPDAFGMDEDGAIAGAIKSGYREVVVLCGKPVLVRSDRTIRSLTLPVTRCDRIGPEWVKVDVPVTRGFTTH